MSFIKAAAPPSGANVLNIGPTGANFMVNNPNFDPRSHIQVTSADSNRPATQNYASPYNPQPNQQMYMPPPPGNQPNNYRNMLPQYIGGSGPSPFEPYSRSPGAHHHYNPR